MSGRRGHKAWLVLALLLSIGFRLAVVTQWHVPAGDGLRYHRLAQELSRAHRFALGPREAETFTHLPGYPLFLAFVAVRDAPLDLESHLVRATQANVALDLLTALLVFLLLRELGAGRVAPWAAALGVIACPILLLMSCYGLSESLATMLLTLELYLAARAMRRASLGAAAACGAVAGYAQLVRADASTLVPVVLLALALMQAPWRRRLAAMALCGLVAGAVFAPWPIRNQLRFGAPHFEGHEWPAQDGSAQPLGMIRWLRTWAQGARGEAYVPFRVVNRVPIDPAQHLNPAMWDSEEERREVVALFERYNRERLSPEVDRGFVELAEERTRRHPFRTYVRLPLGRLMALWTPAPEYELPMRVPFLGLPPLRNVLMGGSEVLICAFALVGVIALARQERRLLALLLLPVVTRSALHAYAVPHAVNQRYLVEAFPCLIMLAACGLEALRRRLWPRRQTP